jgi:hypothetical protein
MYKILYKWLIATGIRHKTYAQLKSMISNFRKFLALHKLCWFTGALELKKDEN